ncbi:hypothetical protein E2C01_030457 [Portunus trituberculatus]|uniref:Uncharacterized protein n=1 Tax=Portunus trituberculatus TaxID=210409 RepID=A0A5B7EXC9_PORTR|nr:hypothetical protein [Portunus trituberculatus]
MLKLVRKCEDEVMDALRLHPSGKLAMDNRKSKERPTENVSPHAGPRELAKRKERYLEICLLSEVKL